MTRRFGVQCLVFTPLVSRVCVLFFIGVPFFAANAAQDVELRRRRLQDGRVPRSQQLEGAHPRSQRAPCLGRGIPFVPTQVRVPVAQRPFCPAFAFCSSACFGSNLDAACLVSRFNPSAQVRVPVASNRRFSWSNKLRLPYNSSLSSCFTCCFLLTNESAGMYVATDVSLLDRRLIFFGRCSYVRKCFLRTYGAVKHMC